MRKAILFLFLAVPAFTGCASLTIRAVDYSWSFESVFTADSSGYVRAEPKTIAFDARELFRAETNDPAGAAGAVVRMIRDSDGYYFITSAGFKHVYIFTWSRAELSLKKRVLIAEQGMTKPYFNRRPLGIELVANGQTYLLNRKGIIPGDKK